MQGWKRETTHNIQEGSDWLRGYRCSDESGNEMGAHILNEVEVWRFHFKAIFPYLRISNAPPRCNRIERASKRARIGWRSRSCPAPILPPARPLTAIASMHASVTAAAFIITRKYPHPLRPPSSVLPSSPARLREKKGRVATNRRTRTRGRSDGSRADRGADAECHAGGASLVPLFSGRQARSKETSRGRPRGARRGRPTVNSIPWAPAG